MQWYNCIIIIIYDAAKLENVVKFMCPLGPFSLAQSHIVHIKHVPLDSA